VAREKPKMTTTELFRLNPTQSNFLQTPSDAKAAATSPDSPIVLLIEDDPAIAETIGFALRQGGFTVHWCAQGLLGLEQFQTLNPSLVILDVGLPDIGGFEVCRRIRQQSQKPVLFLTAHSDEIDRIQGFELGADDYIAKPFSPRELVSRVRAVLRRAGANSDSINSTTVDPAAVGRPASLSYRTDNNVTTSTSFRATTYTSTDVIVNGSIRCFSDQARVLVDQISISLTRTEFKLLEHLMRAPLRVFSREQLLNALQGAGSPTGDRAIDTHIKTLRAKISQAKNGLDPIKTHRGLGYSFEPEA
jgi:two-component system, OmpR family, catabolic regulation response regulator CreB